MLYHPGSTEALLMMPFDDFGFPPPGDTLAVGWRHWVVLALCAMATLALYPLLLDPASELAETVPSHAAEVVPWVWPVQFPPTEEEAGKDRRWFAQPPLRYCALLLGLFVAYGVALRTVAGRSSRALEAAVFGLATVYLAFHVVAPIMLSGDVYLYAVFGRLFAFHHVNPAVDFAVLPADDLYLRLWKDEREPSPYGPVWTLISAAFAWVGGEQVGLTVLLFRGVACLGVLGASAVLWSALRRVAPHRAAQGLVFFLWNPLVVLEAGLSGHNDAVMIALFLAGIGMHLRCRTSLAMVFFILSALVKYATCPLVAIYLLMCLRRLPDWRSRARFAASAAVAAALIAAVTFGAVRVGSRAPSAPTAESAPWQAAAANVFEQRYYNSVHELLYRALRLGMGEEPQDVREVEFRGWWVAPTESTEMRAGEAPTAATLGRVEPGTPLLVIARRLKTSPWLRVYDPMGGRKGYVLQDSTDVVERPALAQADPALLRWELGWSPTAVRATAWLRWAMWSVFGLAWLWAAWYASNLRRFLVSSASLMLASYWLIAAWIFPWYVIWALALAAFVPASTPALLAVFLSATALTLYATIGYERTGATEWIFTYRSLPAFVLPLLLFVPAVVRRWRSQSARVRNDHDADRQTANRQGKR
jgi:hypothetical protein